MHIGTIREEINPHESYMIAMKNVRKHEKSGETMHHTKPKILGTRT